MGTGHLVFGCGDRRCKFEIAMGKCVYEFLKLIFSVYRNTDVQIGLEEFGIAPETIEKFRSLFVITSNDGTLIKIDPSISNEREGTVFPNVFRTFK